MITIHPKSKDNIKQSVKPVLVVGVPRSGSTWTARVLSQAPNTVYIHEPDNEFNNILGCHAKKKLSRFPYLKATSMDRSYYNLWKNVFYSGIITNSKTINMILYGFSELFKITIGYQILPLYRNSRSNDNTLLSRHKRRFQNWHQSVRFPIRIVKSVHAGFALPFISRHFDPEIVIIFRHPANIAASYLKLNMPDRDRMLYRDHQMVRDYLAPYISNIQKLHEPLELIGLQIGIFYYIWEQQIKINTSWQTLTHELLCLDSTDQFKKIYKRLNLKWTDNVKVFIQKNNQPGRGFQTQRILLEEPEKWKLKLSRKQIQQIRRGYHLLPVEHYNDF